MLVGFCMIVEIFVCKVLSCFVLDFVCVFVWVCDISLKVNCVSGWVCVSLVRFCGIIVFICGYFFIVWYFVISI